jgi:hypothetical protein
MTYGAALNEAERRMAILGKDYDILYSEKEKEYMIRPRGRVEVMPEHIILVETVHRIK